MFHAHLHSHLWRIRQGLLESPVSCQKALLGEDLYWHIYDPVVVHRHLSLHLQNLGAGGGLLSQAALSFSDILELRGVRL